MYVQKITRGGYDLCAKGKKMHIATVALVLRSTTTVTQLLYFKSVRDLVQWSLDLRF